MLSLLSFASRVAGTRAADVFAATGPASLVFLVAVEVLPTFDVVPGLEVAAVAERPAAALDPTLAVELLLLLAG